MTTGGEPPALCEDRSVRLYVTRQEELEQGWAQGARQHADRHGLEGPDAQGTRSLGGRGEVGLRRPELRDG